MTTLNIKQGGTWTPIAGDVNPVPSVLNPIPSRIGCEFTWGGTASSNVDIPWNTSNWASAGFVLAAQVNIPEAGIYIVTAISTFATVPPGNPNIVLRKNTTPIMANIFPGGTISTLTGLVTLVSGDKLSIQSGHGGVLTATFFLNISKIAL